MSDTSAPSHETLFETAAGQSGYFTTRQAHAAGFSDPLISHHAKRGRFVRVTRGVYRLRDFPSVPREEIAAAWLAFAPSAAVSHESALDLLGLADIIPNAVHISVPRSRRNAPRIPGVAIHTTTKSLEGDEVMTREGIRVTSATRTLVDVAEGGSAPDQVVAATRRAIRLGMTTPGRLRQAIATMSPRSAALIRAGMPGPASTRYERAAIVLRPGEGRAIDLGNFVMSLKVSGDVTGGAFSLLEAAEPADFGPPMHIHHDCAEAFFVLEGEYRIFVEADEFACPAGSFIYIPSGLRHGFRVGPLPSRKLNLYAPAAMVGYFDALSAAITSGHADPGRLDEIARASSMEVVGPVPEGYL